MEEDFSKYNGEGTVLIKNVIDFKRRVTRKFKTTSKRTDKYYWYCYPRIRDIKSRIFNKLLGSRDSFKYQDIFIDILC